MSNIVDELTAKTMKELEEAGKPNSDRRSWKSVQGYKFLVQWSNLVLLRILIRKITDSLPKSEYRLKSQVDDASRSTIANLEEGWKRATTEEYSQFLGYSQGSLEEVKGDVERMLQDGFIKSVRGGSLVSLGVDLKAWNEWCRNPLNSSRILYFPLRGNKGVYRTLKELRGNELTYEMLIELINKSDWLLRRLVQSLDTKIRQDKYKKFRW